MESIPAARRTEDIALDLLKFVASQANVGSKSAGSTGFGLPTSPKSGRSGHTPCSSFMPAGRQAVEAPVEKK